MINPRTGAALGLREAALLCLGFGCGILGLAGPVLSVFGRRGEFASSRRIVSRRLETDPQT